MSYESELYANLAAAGRSETKLRKETADLKTAREYWRILHDERTRFLGDAEAALAEALKVLKRYADLADNYNTHHPDDWVGYRGAVYVSDLRAARAFVEKHGSGS